MRINFNEVSFSKAYGTVDQLPASLLSEVSFAGRSNVGKSSLINKLFGRKSLAKVSATPGKTATINFYNCGKVDFVDLPGYGFAKVSKSEKARWAALIDGYFQQKRRFALVCSLVDIRHDASPLDAHMVSFLAELGLPFAVVFTKADKLGSQKAQNQASSLLAQLEVPEGTPWVLTSSEKGTGIPELRKLIEEACTKERSGD
jgi:GTP-binding protein